ncbi:MAG: GuaB1 family IMP dehydrogenase-related protein [Cryobacterium sp.]|nr:GuaB1 family IMP dehydrogenase-related protein [Cryobacterium sp.]
MKFHGSSPQFDLTYSDVFLIPSRSEISSRLDVSLETDDGTGTTIPLVSANMNSVTGQRLAAAMAKRGGLGVLPQDLSLQDLDAAIRWVKDQHPVFDSALELPSDATVAQARNKVPASSDHGIVVKSAGGDLLGCFEASVLASASPGDQLEDLISDEFPSIDADDGGEPRRAFDLLVEAGTNFAPVVRHGVVIGTISRKGALRATIYKPNLDSGGRLKVAAAIGISGDVQGKARALADAGVDVLVLDTAHGDQKAMLDAVEAVADLDLKLPLVAGNVVTASAVRDLSKAGATIIKVGVGPGAMCTTRMMTAVGRPQFSAVIETAEAARELGAAVWADGGVRYPRDVALALAAGASSVMIGSWFAGTVESPGELSSDESGRVFKESWGMASTKAVQSRFGRLNAFDLARRTLFAEGISSSRIYLDPLRPSVEDLIDMITSGVRSSLSYAGAKDLKAFRDRAVVGIQSAAGYEEGKALPVSW